MNVPLSGTDLVALVDDEDWPVVSRHRWRLGADGYPFTQVGGHYARLHCLIMGDRLRLEVDHISRDKRDNRKANLRHVAHHINCLNTAKRAHSRQPYKGVQKNMKAASWSARITVRGQRIYLGSFRTPEAAAAAYERAALEQFGCA